MTAQQPVPAGFPVAGPDVSSHNAPVSWPTVAAGGSKFAYIKATEADYYTNPYYTSDVAAAKANGLVVGPYAWLRPDYPNPVAQADFFLRAANYTPDAQSLPPMLDLEWGTAVGSTGCYGLSPAQMSAWIRQYVTEIQQVTGRDPVIYTNVNWWNPCTGNDASFGNLPLDIANWNSDPRPLPAGWSDYTFWQYTDNAAIGGAGVVDGNVFNGTAADLATFAVAGNHPFHSDLVRTAADPAVYLVSGQARYAVTDLATLQALAPLGSVGVVSAAYLAGFTTGRALGRFVRGPDGAVYLLDGTGLHQAPTCAMVYDFGDDCGSTVPLTSTQIALFARSTPLAQIVSAYSGKTFWMAGGTKREAFDDASLTQAGMSGPRVALDEAALSARPYGPPVIRDDVLAVSRADASVWLSRNGGLTNVPRTINAQNTWSRQLTTGLLDPDSINALGHDVPYNGFVRSVDHARYYLITPTSRLDITDPAQWSTSWASFSDALLGSLPDGGPVTSPGYLKGASTDVVTRLTAAVARPVSTFPALVALAGGAVPAITTVTDDVAAALTTGPRLLQPGGFVLDPGTGAVSLVDGTTGLVHLPSFATAANLGLPASWSQLAPGDAAAYPSRAADLSALVTCGSVTYLGRGGTLQSLTSSTALPTTALTSLTCAALRLPVSSAATTTVATEVFARAEGNPTVYRVTASGKQPVSNWSTLITLNGGGQDPVIAVLAPSLLTPLPTGAAL